MYSYLAIFSRKKNRFAPRIQLMDVISGALDVSKLRSEDGATSVLTQTALIFASLRCTNESQQGQN